MSKKQIEVSVCDECGKEFVDSEKYREHEAKHQNEKSVTSVGRAVVVNCGGMASEHGKLYSYDDYKPGRVVKQEKRRGCWSALVETENGDRHWVDGWMLLENKARSEYVPPPFNPNATMTCILASWQNPIGEKK